MNTTIPPPTYFKDIPLAPPDRLTPQELAAYRTAAEATPG